MIDTENLFKSPEDIERMTAPYMTEDSLFGYTSHFSYKNFLDTEKVAACREQITQTKASVPCELAAAASARSASTYVR